MDRPVQLVRPFFPGVAIPTSPWIPQFSQSKASLASVSGFVAKNKGALSDKISALPGLGSLAMNVKGGFKPSHWSQRVLFLIGLKPLLGFRI